MKRLYVAVPAAFAAAVVSAANCDSLGNIGYVRLKGYLGERLDAMVERHVAARDVDYITAPFMEKTERTGKWQTEFWGKWMHSSVAYLRYATDEKCKVESVKCKVAKELCSKIERGIERILASQEECGYIGNYPDELRCGEGWDVWGMKYTLMGLLHYYDLAGGPQPSAAEDAQERVSPGAQRALEAAKRLCDYVIAEIGPNGKRGRELWQTGNWSGYASSSILEPVVWLYRRVAAKDGKDAAQRYLDFAVYIVKGMTEPASGPRLVDLALKGVSVADRNGYGNTPETHGGYVVKHNRWKAYEMMSCYQGLLEYCEIVKLCKYENTQYPIPSVDDILKAAVMTAEDIVKEEINLAGGCASSEAWFHGAKKQHLPYIHLQETCVTTTWMRFCEKLLEITDDARWADQIERTFYNAYLGALRTDGGEFAAYTPLTGNRWHGMNHCYMHTDCCTANGPRGFLCFLKELFTTRGDVATFNFYSSALVKGEFSDGRKVAFDMYSLYPRTDNVRIVSHTTGSVPVRFRIPAWSATTEVKLNGKVLDGVKAGEYFTVLHDWKLGDIVQVRFDMPVVAHSLAHHVAFTRGPVMLARDSRFADGDMAEPFRGGIKDGQKMSAFAAVRTPSEDVRMAFSATLPIGSHHENPEGRLPTTVFFCDYASAGNTWRRDNYYRTWFPVEFQPTE
ncbi:MAG: glycoside hydrolase family 127 protein [Kiritimatiellae bacterium]|nr:glycoside hydrolase family 127 protein [Kiritimatiellia bacterium]